MNECDGKVEGIGDRNMRRGDRGNGWEDEVGWRMGRGVWERMTERER